MGSVLTDSSSENCTRIENELTSRLPDRFGISMRCFCVPSTTTAVLPWESGVVVGLQLVSAPMSPFLPAPSLALPDRSGTVGPEMFRKSRSMIGAVDRGTSPATGEALASNVTPAHRHAATIAMLRPTGRRGTGLPIGVFIGRLPFNCPFTPCYPPALGLNLPAVKVLMRWRNAAK